MSIPPIKYKGGRKLKYPFDKLIKQASITFFVKDDKEKISACNAARQYGKLHGFKVEIRTEAMEIAVYNADKA